MQLTDHTKGRVKISSKYCNMLLPIWGPLGQIIINAKELITYTRLLVELSWWKWMVIEDIIW